MLWQGNPNAPEIAQTLLEVKVDVENINQPGLALRALEAFCQAYLKLSKARIGP